jgi:hypothetical protein
MNFEPGLWTALWNSASWLYRAGWNSCCMVFVEGTIRTDLIQLFVGYVDYRKILWLICNQAVEGKTKLSTIFVKRLGRGTCTFPCSGFSRHKTRINTTLKWAYEYIETIVYNGVSRGHAAYAPRPLIEFHQQSLKEWNVWGCHYSNHGILRRGMTTDLGGCTTIMPIMVSGNCLW